MASEAGELRRRVMALGRRTRGARIPDELRAEVIRYAMERRRHGDRVGRIAQALGVSPESIRRWTTRTKPSATGRTLALVPIVVRDDDDAPTGRLTLAVPGGYRVDGLTVATAAALLRALGSTRTLCVWAYPEPANLRAGFDGPRRWCRASSGAIRCRVTCSSS